MTMQQEFMEINGASLYVTRMGSPGNQTIIFLHGGPGLGDSRGDIQSFEPLAENFHLVYLDLRGSGRSSETPPFTHTQWVEDIETLRRTLDLGQVILHGSSYGGFLAQEYAVKYPHNLTFLLLNVTTPDGTNDQKAIDNAKNSDRCQLSDEELQRIFSGHVRDDADFRYLYAAILPLYMVELDAERDQKKLDNIHFHYQTHNEAFQNLIHYDVKDQLKVMTVPTLITAGEVDWITPPIYAKQIHELLPNSDLVIFKGLGHSLVREETELYMKIIKDFMTQSIQPSEKIYHSRRYTHDQKH